MTTEHYDPPTADELAAYEECRARPDMVDKDMEVYAELGSLAYKMREILFSEIRGIRSELDEAKSELETAKFEVDCLEYEIGRKCDLASSLGMLLCEDRFEMKYLFQKQP